MTHSVTENMPGSQSSSPSTLEQHSLNPWRGKRNPFLDYEALNADTPLLKLPLETRQEILKLLLPYTSLDDRYGPVWHHGSTSLLHTCRQLRKESVAILYSSNTFVFKISPQGSPRIIVRDPSDLRPPKAIRSLMVRPEPEARLIRKLHIEIMECDTYFRSGEHWMTMNWPENKRLERSPLVLQEKIKDLLGLLPQWGGGVGTARVLWVVNQTRMGKQERQTILQPLHDAGVVVEEEVMLEVDTGMFGMFGMW